MTVIIKKFIRTYNENLSLFKQNERQSLYNKLKKQLKNKTNKTTTNLVKMDMFFANNMINNLIVEAERSAQDEVQNIIKAPNKA